MKQDEREKLYREVMSKKRSMANLQEESLNILKNVDNEIAKLVKHNTKEIEKLSKDFDYSDEALVNLQKDIEKDFNIKIDTPKEVVRGKETKVIFDDIEQNINKVVLGQKDAIKDLVLAFRRPYVSGIDVNKIRNSILISGPNGTGRHLLIKTMANELKRHDLITSNEIAKLDMNRYKDNSQETIFLQDLYMALHGKNAICIIENFELGHPSFNRMLTDLVINSEIILNKNYVFKNGYLQEMTSGLQGGVVNSLQGNNKIIVFITNSSLSKVMDIFGKAFIDEIQDKITTIKLDEDSLNKIIDNFINDFINKIKVQLEIDINVDTSIKQYLHTIYEPNDGVDSLLPKLRYIYDEIVQIVLENNEIKTCSLIYDKDIKVLVDALEIIINNEDNSQEEKEQIKNELNAIVGLKEVKDYLLSLEDHIKVVNIRKKRGLKTTEISKHMIFKGNPGTGKTTIARLVSRMMKASGILKQGQLVEVTRADLVGRYVGHTAPITSSVINSALGGVLFIDEAYSLYRGKDDSFGLEAIDTLVKAMEDHRDELIVILAGYSKEMDEFLKANSGLKSRFPNIINFEDYTGEELLQIAISIAQSKEYQIDKSCFEALQEYFTRCQLDNSQTSGNGRLARNVVEEAILKQAKRIINDENAALELLLLEDFDLD